MQTLQFKDFLQLNAHFRSLSWQQSSKVSLFNFPTDHFPIVACG